MNKKRIQKVLATFSLVTFVVTWYFTFGVNPLGWNDSLAPAARASSIVWVGGSTGNWESALNWSGGTVPTSADDVAISSTTTNIVVTVGTTADFNSLTIGGVETTTAAVILTGNIGTGGSITVRTKGTLTQNNAVTQTISGALTAEATSTLNHTANPGDATTQDYGFLFSVGSLDLQTSSTLTAASKGFSRANCDSSGFTNGVGPGSGLGATAAGSGAAHGGLGGQARNSGPLARDFVYGSVSAPTTYGSSGGNVHFGCGGAGGGAIKVSITGGGTATVNGTISANGGNSTIGNDRHPGGGSGGSIWLDFTSGGTFAGSGLISAIGGSGGAGNAFDDAGGGGGGGRIAITGHSTETFAGTIRHYGGTGGNGNTNFNTGKDGGGGTLYKKLNSATYPDLYIQNATSTDGTKTYSSSTITVANLFVSDNAYYTITTGTTFTITSSSLGATAVSSTINVDGTFVTPSSFTITGKNQLIAKTSQISGITDLTVGANSVFVIEELTTSSPWSLGTLTVSGILTTPTNTASIVHSINISATTINITAAGRVSADGTGYQGGAGINNLGLGTTSSRRTTGFGPGGGENSDAYGGGGGYGGAGGKGSNATSTGGAVYGTTNTPHFDAGSGGGAGYYNTTVGGNGGGIINLEGTTVTVDGALTAHGTIGTNGCGGTPATGSGGGAGGGIRIAATTINGGGAIAANGGNGGHGGSTCSGGGGGGGRVLLVAENYNFTGAATTTGGGVSSFVGVTAIAGATGTTALAPYAPSNLYTGTTTAQTGSTNPVFLATTTPSFSAIFSDPETNDFGVRAHIQISTSSSFTTITHWDSGSTGTPITTCLNGARCQDIKYGNFGSAPTLNLSLNDDGSESVTQTLYYWRIRFFDERIAAGNYSTTTATFTLLDAPTAPTNVVSSSVATSSITWAWTDASSYEDNYEFASSSDGVTFGSSATSSANSTTTTISDLAPNTPQYFRVRGTNSAGSSPYTTSSVIYTLANAPASASAIAGTANAATITWSANGNATDTAYYVVDASSASNNSGWVTSTGYTFTNLSAGTSYTFSIKARNAQGIETAAVTASVTTPSGSSGGDTGGGGGGGDTGTGGDCTAPTCVPDPRPTCDRSIDPNCDLVKDGLIKITKRVGGPLVGLTNQRNVFVEMSTTFADMVALKGSDGAPSVDFGGVGFETVKSSVAWSLTGVDGKKCVNARFKDSLKGFKYDTYACTILDTTPPPTPVFFITGINNQGKVTGRVRISSLVATEPSTRLTLVVRKGGANVGTFYVDTDGAGNWTLLIPGNVFSPGAYEISSSLSDLAGNISETARLTVTVTTACTGTDCGDPNPSCPPGTSGAYPQCRPNTDEPKCPDGTRGSYPLCEPNMPDVCPPGTSGPDCKPDKPEVCPPGTSGTYPQCRPNTDEPKCPEGTSGVYPQCKPNDQPCVGAACSDDRGDGEPGDGEPGGNGPGDNGPGNGGDGGDGGDGGTGGPDGSGNGGNDGGSGSGSGSSGSGSADSNNGSTGSAGSGSTNGAGGVNGGVGGSGIDGGEVTIPTSLTPAKPVVDTRGPVAKVVAQTVDKAVEFVSDPQVQTVNKVAVAPTLAAAAIANALAGVGAASMLNFMHFIFAQPILALRRRNHKAWGVVYNAYSKLPIDLAAVRLIDADTGRVLQSQVTDLQGRYFMATPDPAKKYRLEVSKAGYKGIADLKQTDDAPFLNLYHGTSFAAAPDHPEIAYSIPLEPDTGNPSALQIIRAKAKETLHRAASSFGLVFSVISFVVTPSLLIGAFVAMHALVYGLFYIVGYKLKPDAWGVVRDKAQKTRLGRVVVRVFDAAYNKLVSTAVTDGNGRYAVLVGPSKFVVTYEKIGYDKAQSEPLDFGPDKTKGRGGIINRSEVLQKAN